MYKHLTYALTAMLLAGPAIAKDPYEAKDDTWISLSGSVVAVTGPDTFSMSYGDGIVTVEMDDWDLDADAWKLVKDDRITVTGRVDDDMFEAKTIEAASVYVENLGTYFYASSADEEANTLINIAVPVAVSKTLVQGQVTEVDGSYMTVAAGSRRVLVDASGLASNPLDGKGSPTIKKGDWISVTGEMNTEFWENRELDAEHVFVLSKANRESG